MGKGEAVEISLGTETIFIGKTMKLMVMIMGIIIVWCLGRKWDCQRRNAWNEDSQWVRHDNDGNNKKWILPGKKGKAIRGDAWVDREGHNDTCHQHHRRRREGIKLERPKGMPFRGPLTSCFEYLRHRQRDPPGGLPVVSMFNGTFVGSDGILYL